MVHQRNSFVNRRIKLATQPQDRCRISKHIDPKYADAYNNRGLAYRAKGDYDHAIADYNEAIRLDPR